MSEYGSVRPPPPQGPPPTPAYGYPGFQGTPPPDYLVWAILSTVLCFLPLGVFAIVFAAQVRSKWAVGDVAGAEIASVKARNFAIGSAVVMVVLVIAILGFALAVGALTWSIAIAADPGR